jgi:hypothetical protein
LAAQEMSGIAGLTNAELQREIARGGRVVVFQYCISVLILSFKRSSPLTLVRSDENALLRGLPYSIISLILGWWGIPWGPIWTIMTLITNLGGGKDVTPEVTVALGGTQNFAPRQPPVIPNRTDGAWVPWCCFALD